MGMTGSWVVSGMDDWYLGRRYDWWLDVGDGWAGCGEDSFGSAEGNMMVGDGSGLVRGVMKDGKAPEDDKGNENFKGGS